MSRVQLALRVSDLQGSIDFYRKLFGVEPAKLRPGYANFAVAEPPLKLVLIEGHADQPTVMDHLGVEVATSDEVDAATARLSGLLSVVDLADDAVIGVAEDRGVRRPRPVVVGGALVGSVTGWSS